MNITRATFTIQPSLLQRLRIFAKEQNQSISAVVEEAINAKIQDYEAKRLDRMYQGLKKIEGAGDRSIRNASDTIDEVLYGQKTLKKDEDE